MTEFAVVEEWEAEHECAWEDAEREYRVSQTDVGMMGRGAVVKMHVEFSRRILGFVGQKIGNEHAPPGLMAEVKDRLGPLFTETKQSNVLRNS